MRLRRKDTCRQVESLVKQKCGKPATLVSPLVIGGLNIHYRVYLEGEDDSSDVMARLPWPYAACFPGEKVVYEAATAEFLRLNTRILLPRYSIMVGIPTSGRSLSSAGSNT